MPHVPSPINQLSRSFEYPFSEIAIENEDKVVSLATVQTKEDSMCHSDVF